MLKSGPVPDGRALGGLTSGEVLEGILRRMCIPALLAFAMFALAAPAMAQVTFPDGVASGDVTSTRAILWTKASVADNIKVEVFNNAALVPPKVFQGKFKTSAARDYKVKIDAT